MEQLMGQTIQLPEFTFHFQRSSVHGLTMQETIRSAKSSNGVVVLRGDATGHDAEIQLLRESGVQFRDQHLLKINKKENLWK